MKSQAQFAVFTIYGKNKSKRSNYTYSEAFQALLTEWIEEYDLSQIEQQDVKVLKDAG